MPKTITISWDWIRENIEKVRKIVSQIVEWVVLGGILFFLYRMVIELRGWWKPDYSAIGDFLDVKLSSLVVNLLALIVVPWLWTKLIPKNLLRKAAEDSLSSAIIMGSFILGLSLILMAK